ncbi:hypothetical protein LIT25_23100 [Bacillus sp. F19]|nr:hypothetical protein LIT25_23100 [Bacillus sp. F19]
MKYYAASVLIYLFSVGLLYAAGYAFEIVWLKWEHTVTYEDGSIKAVSGSIIPFFLCVPIYYFLIRKAQAPV